MHFQSPFFDLTRGPVILAGSGPQALIVAGGVVARSRARKEAVDLQRSAA